MCVYVYIFSGKGLTLLSCVLEGIFEDRKDDVRQVKEVYIFIIKTHMKTNKYPLYYYYYYFVIFNHYNNIPILLCNTVFLTSQTGMYFLCHKHPLFQLLTLLVPLNFILRQTIFIKKTL